jgi:hypothetical protein
MSNSFENAPIRPDTGLGSEPSTTGSLAIDHLEVVVPDTPESLVTPPPRTGITTIPDEPAPVAPRPESSSGTPTPTTTRGRGTWIALVIGTALIMLAAGIGLGYATGAGTRSDLSAAQAQVSTLNDKVAALTSSNAAADAATATNASRAAACQTAMTASNRLTAQWENLWSDLDRAMSASSASASRAVLAHMEAQYSAMQQEQGRVNALMAQCTGNPA